MDNEQNTEYRPKSSKKYNKHSTWYWVVVYLIIAAIIYGLIYALFFSGSTNY